MVDQQTIEKAKQISIIELAYRLGIEVKGTVCRCISPSHEDKNPSMSFKIETNAFKCFSCGFHGDTIALVRQARNCEFIEAVEFILNESLNQTSASEQKAQKHPLKRNLNDSKEKGEKYSDIYSYFLDLLPFPDEDHYLIKDRCLSIKVLKENNIKAIKKEKTWDCVKSLLNIFTEDRLCKSGLISLSKNQKPYLFFFKCVALIPFYDQGQIIYLQGICDKRDSNKASNLMGIKKPVFYYPKVLEERSSKEGVIHVLEGAIDTLSGLTIGYMSIGIIDAGVRVFNEIDRLKNFPIVLIGDFDKAGLDAKIRLYKYLQEIKFDVSSLSIIKLANKLIEHGLIKSEDTNKIKDMNDILKIIKKEKSNGTLK
ncbi:MAG: DNA primase [Candidatus Anoxychlamydiales bacterium]|nr:DNA primase [Candidatus Anoxychlamydiales bacterium]